MTNFNDELGYPYGTFDARHHMDLYDDITLGGNDLTYKQAEDDIYDVLKATIERRNLNLLNDCVMESLRQVAGEIATEELCDDEEMHDYDCELEDGTKLHLTNLGGAPLCYVIRSDWVCGCWACSPCVPGAGDLDSPNGSGTNRMLALCLSPEDMQELANAGGVRYTVLNIKTQELVEVLPQEEEVMA